MRVISKYETILKIVLPAIALFGCSNRSAIDLEIIRAFETGAVDLTIEVEPISDGYSIVYRASVIDRTEPRQIAILQNAKPTTVAAGISGGDIRLEGEAPFADPERFDYLWSVDGEPSSGSHELYTSFTEPGRHEVSVTVSLGGKSLANLRRTFTAVSLGNFRSGETVYLTLAEPMSVFAVPGKLVPIDGEVSDTGSVLRNTHLLELGVSGGTTVLRAGLPGYYLITSVSHDIRYETNVFVSPIPTYHVDRNDRNWYFTQWRTRTSSNCGPSVVSMGLSWAIGANVPVETVRSHLGWNGTGAVSMPDLKSVLDTYGVSSKLHWIESPDELFPLLDSGSLIGVVYDMAGISFTENAIESLFGQYYVDSGGHYLMIKGYSLDRRYFVVYDPIPSDWRTNALRYGDGTSMIGRNRYYDVNELFDSLRARQILEIMR